MVLWFNQVIAKATHNVNPHHYIFFSLQVLGDRTTLTLILRDVQSDTSCIALQADNDHPFSVRALVKDEGRVNYTEI